MQTKRLTKSEKDALPKKADKYYYIFSSMVSHRHEVREATFFNGISERMRIAKGNCYMTKAGAQVVCDQINEFNDELNEHYLAAEIDEVQQKMRHVLD